MGYSLTQIATSLNVPKSVLSYWGTSEKALRDVWELGRDACQSYHESLLSKMISKEIPASSAEIEAQKYKLRVMFKEDWSEKQESKLEIAHTNNLSDEEIQVQLERLLIKPHNKELIKSVKGFSLPSEDKSSD